MGSVLQAVDRFFHARTKHAYWVTGILRIGYALLVLYDRCILSLDFDHFFLHTMPISVSSRDLYTSILWLAPDNAAYYYFVHGLSFVFAIMLLLGIAPRVQLAGLLVTMSAFWTHNNRIWDSQDNMFRYWGVFLLFLPLKSVSVHDKFRWRWATDETRTWPMWPFRIWQFQLMAIYSCAGLAKLVAPEWQNGRAMLHVVQTTDLYGGIFNPDIIFNRMGPLMIMTYLSLMVECAGLVTAWIWPLPTVFAMYGLHLGIEVSMNMHCLEWLCMLAWLTFLVQPEKAHVVEERVEVLELPRDPDESTETVEVAFPLEEETGDASEVSKTTTSSEGDWSTEALSEAMRVTESPCLMVSQPFKFRHIGSCILIYIGLAIFLETAPLERFHGSLPAFALPYLERSIELQKYLAATISHPVTTPLRLRQSGWYMYSIPPMESYRFEIVMTHADGSRSTWESPKWESMTWCEKKRWQRPMSFYDRFASSSWEEMDAFTRHIAQQHGSDVAYLELYQHREGPNTLPNDMEFGFFKEALQPLVRFQTTHLYSLNICSDFDTRCTAWASEGYCHWPISTEMGACRYSCGRCNQSIGALSEGSRVAVIWPYDNMYYRGTVRKIQPHSRPQVLVEYDAYNTDEDRYEWMDQHKLWQRQLIILREEMDARETNTDTHHHHDEL